MQASPPLTTDTIGPNAAATPPASTSPSRGPPATTTMKTPDSRPRSASGVAVCRIVLRNTALTMSAAPATASSTTPSHSIRAKPNPVIASPHTTIATSTASPCRCTRPSQPPNVAPSSAPTAMAA